MSAVGADIEVMNRSISPTTRANWFFEVVDAHAVVVSFAAVASHLVGFLLMIVGFLRIRPAAVAEQSAQANPADQTRSAT
jgi:hypothetical protein